MRLLPRLEDKQKNLRQLTKLFHARSLGMENKLILFQ
jgi:hypothetical protein